LTKAYKLRLKSYLCAKYHNDMAKVSQMYVIMMLFFFDNYTLFFDDGFIFDMK